MGTSPFAEADTKFGASLAGMTEKTTGRVAAVESVIGGFNATSGHVAWGAKHPDNAPAVTLDGPTHPTARVAAVKQAATPHVV